jgi:eukaryotic-like serine/threonine-protein kinase
LVGDSLVGGVIDTRYEVRRLVARGGIGLVYEAQHRITRRLVAIKTLQDDIRASKEARARLRREALALTVVRHPGFVEVLDAGVCGDHGPYLVMEMLDGRSLDGILAARHHLPVADAVQVGLQLCDALAHAHAQGVLHRDLKPANFFIARGERGGEVVKVLDLGVAAVGSDQLEGRDLEITGQGGLVGTLEYMAPEQLFGGPQDTRTDIYGIGMSLFECLTGEVPYSGTYAQVVAGVSKAATAPRVRQRRPEVSSALSAVVERALAKEPADRFPSASDVARALVAAAGLTPGPSCLLPPFGFTPGVGEGARAERAIELVRKKPFVAAAVARAGAGSARDKTATQERQVIRVPYVTPVVLVADGQEIEARCEEISESGMLVVSSSVLEERASLEVRFATPVAGEMTHLRADVRWVTSGRGRCAIGLEFAEASEPVRRILAQYSQQFTGDGVRPAR